MKKMFFLAGLPRSGTTLLGAILSQNPEFYASASSPLPGMLIAAQQSFDQSQFTKTADIRSRRLDVLRSLVLGFYEKVTQPIIIEKNRAWAFSHHIQTMEEILEEPVKIICPVRPIADVLASFVSIMHRNGQKSRLEQEMLSLNYPLTDKGRCQYLMDPRHGTVRQAYMWMHESFHGPYRDRLHFLEYDQLIQNPQQEVRKIYEFLGLPLFQHDFENIQPGSPEDDEASYGLPGLHDIRPRLAKTSGDSKKILGEKLWSYYQGGEFWNSKPDPVPEKTILDLQLEAGLRGDFETGWNLSQMMDPADDRAAFNRGWYVLRQGKLLEGMSLLNRGRREEVFGNPPPSQMPIWDGRRLNGETVLLHGEGGLGDQICNARFAKDISERGARVVISCRAELAPLLSKIDGVSAVIEGSVAGGIYHSYYVPAMSAALSLQYEFGDLDGSAYILNYKKNKKKRTQPRVGLRWAGNPQMQHDLYRRFDPEILFQLKGAELVSLQKESDVEIPHHIKQPNLSTWEQTAETLADLDLLITSCTSVAHLGGAMGIPTWILIPVLPYYLWSLPGKNSPWYKSVRLFRQTKFQDWSETFEELKSEYQDFLNQFPTS